MSHTSIRPLANALQPRELPQHCDPTTPFLRDISSTFNTCLPTPLAFASTLVGTLSIFSWLFAQLPQIVRNYRNKSVAGLSVFFLAEWLLGDLSNLLGALLTNQATWQVIIGAYYVFVDVMMVSQWIWYEKLRHGRPLRRIWLAGKSIGKRARENNIIREAQIVGDISPQEQERLQEGEDVVILRRTSTEPQDIPTSKASSANDMFRIPVYGTISPAASLATSPANRSIHRIQQQSLPAASPKTVLFITLLIAIMARGTPVPNATTAVSEVPESSRAFAAGTVLSWCSTVLYLFSRFPQIVFNFKRKSTSGLSPTLFAAAFCGNLFYSTSLALNPNAWQSFGPYGGQGWADADGSNHVEWVRSALPFFIGAAGVLALDGTVGLQFWIYGDRGAEVVVVHEQGLPGAKETAMRVRKVSGWMRGWQPSARGRISPVHGKKKKLANEEEEPLLRMDNEANEIQR